MDLDHVSPDALIVGWDFSTGGVKGLAFDRNGQSLAEVRLPTDLWTQGGVSELNIAQLEGQVRAGVRAMAARLRQLGRLQDWVANGISATHHTAGRIDAEHNQIRRAICWNDQTLAQYHPLGLERLGGQERVRQLIGGPWAIRYSLTHLVKDEATLPENDWRRTHRIAQHGGLVAGFMTGNFDVVSVSAAASTGIMDLRTGKWRKEMLEALENPAYRELVWNQLPRIVDQFEPVGQFSPSLCADAGLNPQAAPLVFPTSDDQQAGLVGGGAVEAGQVAVILGNSAVVNSSAAQPPATDDLDCMRLNWGPYLWMRCYNNGAQFFNHVLGDSPDFARLEVAGRAAPAGSGGAVVLPFVYPEPSLGVTEKRFGWSPAEPTEPGTKFRAALEALSYLIALGIRAHEAQGQKITRISVSGGMARSSLMCEILASVLNRPLERLVSDEGPALGAAVTALAALAAHGGGRADGTQPSLSAAVAQMVKFKSPILPNSSWAPEYERGLRQFQQLAQIEVNRQQN